MTRELEDDDFSSWLMELEDTPKPTYTVHGDGYWCPTHTDGCDRRCDDRRWGKFGAAGILFFHRQSGTFLLNQRSAVIHFGETWSTLGGAINRDETPYAGALRESIEEIGNVPTEMKQIVVHENVTKGEDRDWTYTTFVVEVDEQFFPTKMDWESKDNAWVTLQEMASLPLHPGFRATISHLLAEMYRQGAWR